MRFLGFLGRRVIWPNTASLMLPRDGFGDGDGRLGPFVFSRIIIYIEHGSVLFEIALYSFCSLFYPFYFANHYCFNCWFEGSEEKGM